MSKRIAVKIVLAEDREQQNLVRRYLNRLGHGRDVLYIDLPAKIGGGSGEKYGRDQYPKQVQAFRETIGRRASALLIAIIDADNESVTYRNQQLERSLQSSGQGDRTSNEMIVVLIPKRHIETWIHALLGEIVDELTDYSHPIPTYSEIKTAAETLFTWTRPSAQPGPTCPPSLNTAIPEWQKIPS